jgi:hypothetical protein
MNAYAVATRLWAGGTGPPLSRRATLGVVAPRVD